MFCMTCTSDNNWLCSLLRLFFSKVAAAGNVTELQQILNNDPSRINAQDTRGWSPTHHAASRGFTDVISYISSKGGGIAFIVKS